MQIEQQQKEQSVDLMDKYKPQGIQEAKNLLFALQKGKKNRTGMVHLGSKSKQRPRMGFISEYLELKAGANSVMRGRFHPFGAISRTVLMVIFAIHC